MTGNTYFVTEAYLKSGNSLLPKNLDVQEIVKFIPVIAQGWVEYMIGTHFFEDLLTKYNAQTLSADEITLVSKIQPCIAWRAAGDAINESSYQLSNKGVQKMRGDYSDAAEEKEIKARANYYIQFATMYEGKLKKYLIDNKSLYPEFTSAYNDNSAILKECNDGYNTYNRDITFL